MSVVAIHDFLPCSTPNAWLEAAVANPDLLLIDHANCEKKAASTALSLLYRYVDKPDLIWCMSRLAREELRHFEQVMAVMAERNIEYVPINSARYAAGLRAHVCTHEPAKLVDRLIVGALIEARSCERFEQLAPLLDDQLCRFYQGLLASEARHFTTYLKLAERYAEGLIDNRIAYFAEVERELIEAPDSELRFHSGPPAASRASGGG